MWGIQTRILQDLPRWWDRLSAMPTTLIHNDFNPRNFVLRKVNGERRLCVYDWELATKGVPQHDLSELLCFTWHSEMGREDLNILETYRQALSIASGEDIGMKAWREGFVLALQHLLINRLAMYTMMHSFRPLRYLPGVINNWLCLYSLVEEELSHAA